MAETNEELARQLRLMSDSLRDSAVALESAEARVHQQYMAWIASLFDDNNMVVDLATASRQLESLKERNETIPLFMAWFGIVIETWAGQYERIDAVIDE